MSIDAFIAASRFGLGARPGDLGRIKGDPQGWLLAQLDGGSETTEGVGRSAERLKLFFDARGSGGDAALIELYRKEYRQGFTADVGARTRRAAATDQPFRERLVHFWTNHFTVSAVRPTVAGIAVAFEEEAIRPNVTGRFVDLLLAAIRHPAMLLYLDQAESIGPKSRAGLRRGRGLNENLAREVLELHTLGVDGGYTQTDVRAFAEMLTGWSIGNPRRGIIGEFHYIELIHEPGAKTFLGRTYESAGEHEARAALELLARHPSTARHIAAKLARHFIADRPQAASVDRIARVFLDSGGDLKSVYRAVIAEERAWRDPLTKVRTPSDFVIAALRATGVKAEGGQVLRAQAVLGQPPLVAPSPAGWPDDASAWATPEAMMRRVEFALAFAGRVRTRMEPGDLAESVLGDALSDETGTAIRRAGSRSEALALMLASPEFQRR
ncbi:MAG: DUF1800 domain-containing protein [Alphaproteobacteria bacterium]|nr:DUF1800 domain-containing protein [Alphaproteobacteria bacterium]